MSHICNDNLMDKLAELVEVLNMLRTELELCFSHGRFDEADSVAAELYIVQKEANELADMLDIKL